MVLSGDSLKMLIMHVTRLENHRPAARDKLRKLRHAGLVTYGS